MRYLLAAEDPIEHILPHPLFKIGSLVVTNQMFMALVAAGLMILIFTILFRKASSDAPSGARNFFESILSFLREDVIRPALKEHTDRFVPFLWTLFFFILFCNLLGQIPLAEIGLLVSGGRLRHVGGTATGNINTTGALALCTLVMIHLSGVVQVARNLISGTYGQHHAAPSHGKGMNLLLAIAASPFVYLWNFAPHPFKPEHGESVSKWVMDIPMWFALLVLELIGAVIKPFALMIRLFANMIAGHLVLGVLIGLITLMPTIVGQIGIAIPVSVLALLIRVLELFVAFLQAYIFTFLATLFIASAVAPEH